MEVSGGEGGVVGVLGEGVAVLVLPFGLGDAIGGDPTAFVAVPAGGAADGVDAVLLGYGGLGLAEVVVPVGVDLEHSEVEGGVSHWPGAADGALG